MTEAFQLSGVFTVLPTAFAADGSLDLTGTAALVRAAVDAGVAGLTVLGVMGEAAELSDDERRDVVACVQETARDLSMVVGVSGASATEVRERSIAAASLGAGALMVSPTWTLGVIDAVHAAASAGLPIIVQDYPPASGVTLSVGDLAAAVDGEALVVGVKAEAPPTSDAIAALRALQPTLGLVGGLGGLFLIDELRAGANGVMTGFALPERLVSIVQEFPRDPEGAERAWEALLPLMRLEAFAPASLAARKEVWRLRGVIGSAYCRRAGASLDSRSREDVRRAYERVA